MGIMTRRGDEQLEQIEADGYLSFVVAFDLDIASLPLVTPGLLMRFESGFPTLGRLYVFHCHADGICGICCVTRGGDADEFIHCNGFAASGSESETQGGNALCIPKGRLRRCMTHQESHGLGKLY